MQRDPLNIVGQVVADKYRIEALVGEGGFAAVYRAQHTIWNKPVAIKFFSGLSTAPAEQREALQYAFIQEGALLTELSSLTAGIVQARDVGTYTTPAGQWMPYLVLEWLQGASLEMVLQLERQAGRQAWSVEETLWLLHRVLPSLEVAHQHGVAHRDIKPANLFVVGDEARSPQTTIKILDFGVAKLVENEHLQAALAKTGVGISSFTPQYGAPEQFTRSFGATGPWTDVYAIALVAVELLRGREALEGNDMIQLGFASANLAARPTPRRLGIWVPDEVEAMLERALSVDPRSRHGNAAELLAEVHRITGEPRSRQASAPSLRQTPINEVGQFDGTLLAIPPAGTGPSYPGPPTPLGPALPSTPIVVNAPTLDVPRAATAPRHPTTTGSVSTSMRQQSPPRKKRSYGALMLLVLLGAGGAGAYYVKSQGNTDGAKQAIKELSETASSAAAQLKARVENLPQALPTLPPPSTASSPAPPTPSASAQTPTPVTCPKDMQLIDAGGFNMGSNENAANENEKPAHFVKLSAYCLDTHEVTAFEYEQCVKDHKCQRPAPVVRGKGLDPLMSRAQSKECTFGNPKKTNHPINCVNWHQAAAYCKTFGKRLPTEAEWEYAARGGGRTSYAWGNEEPTPGHVNACGSECVAWAKSNRVSLSSLYDLDDAYPATSPVGVHPRGKSSFGIDDLAGNVWEWVHDYDAPYQASMQQDPNGPPKGHERVLRGGGWDTTYASRLRPSYRGSDRPTASGAAIGFRCAKTPD